LRAADIGFLHFVRSVSMFKPLSEIFNYWFMVVGFIGFYLYFGWTRSLFSILQFNWMGQLFSRVVMIFLSAASLGAAILYIVPDNYNSRTLYILFARSPLLLSRWKNSPLKSSS
jgi:hypothetical protein